VAFVLNGLGLPNAVALPPRVALDARPRSPTAIAFVSLAGPSNPNVVPLSPLARTASPARTVSPAIASSAKVSMKQVETAAMAIEIRRYVCVQNRMRT
jgi:hypothetical protein